MTPSPPASGGSDASRERTPAPTGLAAWLRPERALEMLAAALLFSMMLLTFVDVVLRYLFNAPIRGAFEVSETMMAVLIFAGLPMVSRNGEHIAIDSLVRLSPAAIRKAGALLVQLGCAAALVGMAWLLWLKASRFAAVGDVTQTLKLPIAPVVQLMAALTLFTALIHITLAWQTLRTRDGVLAAAKEDGGGVL